MFVLGMGVWVLRLQLVEVWEGVRGNGRIPNCESPDVREARPGAIGGAWEVVYLQKGCQGARTGTQSANSWGGGEFGRPFPWGRRSGVLPGGGPRSDSELRRREG